MPIINGTAYWASVQKPNTTFDPVYTVDVFVDKKTRDKLVSEYKLQPKEVRHTKAGKISHPGMELGDEFFQFKRKQYRKDKTENPPPEVVDTKGNPITVAVGNGSKVRVRFKPFDWSFAGKSGRSAELTGMQVVELVVYEEEESFDTVDGGYTATGKERKQTDDTPFDDDVPF